MVSAQTALSLSQSHNAAPLPILVLEWRCTHDFFLHPVFLLVFLCTVQGVQIRSIPPGQKWPGFSFALHLLRVQNFCFVLLQYDPIQAFRVSFVPSMQLYRPHRKTAHRALQWHFLRFVPFNRRRYQTDTSGYNTTCATLEGIHAPGRAQQIPDTTATPGRCTGQHRPPIIIRYIRGKPCQPGESRCFPRPAAGGLAPGQRSGLAPSTRRDSPAAGGAEPLAALAASLFGLSPDSQ